ncbi:MAG: acetylglutamate kinase [Bacteroidota bacterium]
MVQSRSKEEVLVEALPWIQRYENKTFVIKYGGAAMTDDTLKAMFAKDVTLLTKVGVKIVIVHGGGKEITEMLNKLQIETRFVNGQRYTDERTLDVVQMVLAGKINKEIVARINESGGNAVGLCGVDGDLIKAKRFKDNGQDIGFVGEITRINVGILTLLLNNGFLPVVAPTGVGDHGELYNINADTVAGEIAAALMSEKLLYLSDVEGVMVNGRFIPSLSEDEAKEFVEKGCINGGMIPKVNSAFKALDAGVKKVHIIDGRVMHSLLLEIFTDEGVGTELIANRQLS